MATTIRSNELKNTLLQLRNAQETGYVSVTVKQGIQTIYGTLQILKGKIVSVEYDKTSGREALNKLSEVEEANISFAKNNVAGASNAQADSGNAVKESMGMNVRTKMLLLFSVLPTLILVGLGFFYISQLNSMSSLITGQGEAIVTDLAEEAIRASAQGVAIEAARHLQSRPGFAKESFQNDPVFRSIAQQPVGTTGYTVLLDGPFDRDGDHVFWVHPSEGLVSQEFAALAGPLGENYEGIRGIIDQVVTNSAGATEGYYNWLDPDGVVRQKYLSTARVEGTDYYIASTTYINEFTQPMVALQESSDQIVRRTQIFVLIAIVIAIVFMVLVVFVYGNRLSSKIQSVSNIAERISMGELDMKIEGTEAKDELGALSRAVERLRVSVQVMLSELSGKQES